MPKRVFFSFHYDDVEMFRANVVRNHWMTKEDRDDAGFFDASMWEAARRTGAYAIKGLINDALEGTSITAVLIGTDTFARRWVRYEILKSLRRGNTLFGIHINGIRDKDRTIKPYGYNPFEHLAVRYDDNGGSLDFLEYGEVGWQEYEDLDGYTLKTQRPREQWGQSYPLNKWYQTYDWITDNGYANFAAWVEKYS